MPPLIPCVDISTLAQIADDLRTTETKCRYPPPPRSDAHFMLLLVHSPRPPARLSFISPISWCHILLGSSAVKSGDYNAVEFCEGAAAAAVRSGSSGS